MSWPGPYRRWAFSFTGTKKGVSEAISAAKPYGGEENANGLQFVAVKQFALAEIAAIPEVFNGCHVEACGHADGNGRNMKLEVTAINIAL